MNQTSQTDTQAANIHMQVSQRKKGRYNKMVSQPELHCKNVHLEGDQFQGLSSFTS